ncbi:hypothetical protein LTR56_014059 [Elasticomyces elasticus]|nr:hypothetical protein LTR22_020285 [Elasticomyces elasticus]KAK3636586.1 hypothetical protein LTR56_014059 [Elasticomyces elasticus]KAK4922396.1 hypothetical protein LTR49_010261 [Elasticomyces elasticus]KAK5765277.1 hypothetical protein LTS12_004534 [Elasticomyces elasticus]
MSSHSAPLLSSSAADLDSSSPSPSLYATFRVLSVVSALQKRFTRRGNARLKKLRVTKAKARRPPFQDIETQAYAEIDRYLGRKTIYSSRRRGRKGQRVSHSISAIETKEQIHRLLSKLDSQVNLDNEHALSSIADQDTLFLERRAHFRIKKLTLSALIELLLNVKNLLHLVQQPDHGFNDRYLANLEHLLLCLHQQLLRLLIKKCIALVRRDDCQRDRKRRDWFSVFPNSVHPESTTGPYMIRPSLAVLWGVCWQFWDNTRFDINGNIVDAISRKVLVPKDIVALYSSFRPQQQRASSSVGMFTHSEFQTQQQQQASYQQADVQMLGTTVGSSRPIMSAAPPSQRQNLHQHQAAIQATTSSSSTINPHKQTDVDLRERAPDRAVQSQAHSTSGTAPPFPRIDNWPPNFLDYDYGSLNQASAYPASNIWAPLSVAESQSLASPLRSTPIDASPYATYYPRTSAGEATSYKNYHNDMAQTQVPHATMQTHNHMEEQPYSPNTDPALVAPNGLKRSHSQMSHNDTQVQYEIPIPYPPPPPHLLQQEERAGSVPSNHDEQSDDSPHHGSRSFKRGNPPQNANLKYYCDFSSECDGMTFDRKCEWSKHMDKHDRPYRCPHSQCGKLQGFTYSGGLLRHEREVHGKHGGPKAALSCPYEDCKRHTGKGFTRKENLNEHIRRVHNDKTPAPLQEHDIEAAEAAAAAFKAGLQEAIAGVAQRPMPAKLPYPEPAPEQQYIPEPAEMVKRRRVEEEPVPTEPEDTPQNEIERLMVENAQQAARIREMETQEARRELRISQLEDMLTQVHSPQQTTHITIDDKILAVAQQT